MRVTDVVKVSGPYRDLRKAQGLLHAISRRLDYWTGVSHRSLTPIHLLRAEFARKQLRAFVRNKGRHFQKPHLRLDRDKFISSQGMLKATARTTMDHIFEGLRRPDRRSYSESEKAIYAHMHNLARIQKTANLRTLLFYEIAYRTQQGWFMVFDTLTVEPHSYYKVFSQGSKAWQQYLRAVKRSSTGQHTYFACVEEGGKTSRLHIHCLHFFERLPLKAKDPNFGRQVPSQRELPCLKPLWEHGFSSPIMVRYSPADAWGRANYRWPYDTRTNDALRVKSPLALAAYMSKYISKSYISAKRDQYQWRTRKTQNLGQSVLLDLLSTLTSQDLLNIATMDSITATINNRRVPPELLRLAALKTYSQHQEKSSKSTLPSLHVLANALPVRPSPLHFSTASIQASPANSQRSIGLTRITDSDDTDGFRDTQIRLNNEAKRIHAKYFATTTRLYGVGSIHTDRR